jgi:hypothetical protein
MNDLGRLLHTGLDLGRSLATHKSSLRASAGARLT